MDDILDFDENKGLVPYLYLKNNEIEAVLSLLEDNNIPYEIEKVYNNSTVGLIPVSSENLYQMITVIHIYEENELRVDDLMHEFYEQQELSLEETEETNPLSEKTGKTSLLGKVILYLEEEGPSAFPGKTMLYVLFFLGITFFSYFLFKMAYF